MNAFDRRRAVIGATGIALGGIATARVLPACSYLVDGLVSREPTTPLTAASTVDLLPPFAGG